MKILMFNDCGFDVYRTSMIVCSNQTQHLVEFHQLYDLYDDGEILMDIDSMEKAELARISYFTIEELGETWGTTKKAQIMT